MLNRPVEPAVQGPTLPKRWQERARLAVKVALIGYLIVYQDADGVLEGRRIDAQHGPLDGTYDVTTFARKGEPVPPLLTDASRWRRLVVYPGEYAQVQMMNETDQYFRYQVDAAGGTVTLTKKGPQGESPTPVAVLRYTRPDPGSLALQGTLGDNAVEIRLSTIDRTKFPLVARGFHWIQEYPYNR